MAFSLPWAFPACGQALTFEFRGFWGLIASIVLSVLIGGGLFFLGRNDKSAVLRKEALAVVGLGWLLAGCLGALPYLFSGAERAPGVPMHAADAIFESLSGFTTTGASVLTELEDPQVVPRCVMFWRSFTHWLGGMGIIVLFVAILGQLGAGGKAMMKREVPGPISEAVRPRVRESALAMWAIYVGISAVETVVLMLEKLTLYDALCHTFGTVATGGFSTHNASIGYFSITDGYNGPLIEWTIMLFMVIAGTNFALYYAMLRMGSGTPGTEGLPLLRRLRPLLRDPEYRLYWTILLTASFIMTCSLLWNDTYDRIADAVRHSSFNAVSIMTTTGYGTQDFHQWPSFCKALLLVLMYVGGCAGSTGGGIKVIRFLLFFKILWLELERAFRPNVVRPLRIGHATIDDNVRRDVIVYFGLMLILSASSWLALVAIESDRHWQTAEYHSEEEKLFDCGTAVAATLNNIGPGMGVVGPTANYSFFSPASKLLLTVLMVLGRLELFAILVLFLPSFWRH